MDLSLLELTIIKTLILHEIGEIKKSEVQPPLYLNHLDDLLSIVEKELKRDEK
jgi:hypothetical protein